MSLSEAEKMREKARKDAEAERKNGWGSHLNPKTDDDMEDDYEDDF